MKSPYDLRRLRPWELVLAGVAVCAPLLLPLASNGGPAFVGTAIAQDMPQLIVFLDPLGDLES